MSKRIILNADEIITCPDCGHEFELRDGITQQTIERYADEYDSAMSEEREKFRQAAVKDAERNAAKTFETRISDLTEKLEESHADSKKLKKDIDNAREKAASEARVDAEEKLKEFQNDLAQKNKKLDEYRSQELKLRQDMKDLEEAKKDFEVQLQRQLNEEKEKIQKQVSDDFNLREAELRKKIEDAQKANDDLKRKLEQGSAQLQGEVLELELEEVLSASFPFDDVVEVKKGVRGADVTQTVMTRTGTLCGKITWEAKRAENWSRAWVAKLKDDQHESGAEIAVLVTTVFPHDTREPFIFEDDIWIVRPYAVRPVAEALRMTLMEKQKQKLVEHGKSEKMEAVYDYLCSPQFAQKVRGVVDAYQAMKSDLEKEKAAMQRLWKKREAQLDRITSNMMGMSGELQGIAEDALPALENIGQLPDLDGE
ncbi:MAG TPA: DUF2130 domain-containing protein [Gammaproteobacteria bacterium]|nr:DUF2130 domain-containing protein [Gammaproteobacteria bacterium]